MSQFQVDEYLYKFRNAIKEIEGLYCPMDDIFLLRFLRTKKFDIEDSIQLLKNYYEMKKINEDISAISFAALQPVFNQRISIVLKERDSEGRKIIYLRAGLWDPSEFSYGELMMASFYMMEELTRSEDTQKNGVIAILDNGGMSFRQTGKIVHHLPFKKIGKLVPFFQGSFPARFKAIHVINAPYVFDMIFSAVKVFLKDKLRKRILTWDLDPLSSFPSLNIFHQNSKVLYTPNWVQKTRITGPIQDLCVTTLFTSTYPFLPIHVHGNNLNTLYKFIQPEILPKSLGGLLTIEEAEDTQLMNDMLSREDFYKNMTKYGFTR